MAFPILSPAGALPAGFFLPVFRVFSVYFFCIPHDVFVDIFLEGCYHSVGENVSDTVSESIAAEASMKIYTIRDIAEQAGVSVTTVSRVLNGRPDVSPQTTEKVRRVMAECHFVGNAHARGLKQADGNVVAIIFRGRQNPFLSALAEEMLQCARANLKIPCVTEYIDERDDEFAHALRLTHSRRVAGLIFVGSRIDERCQALESVNIPMVFATVSAGETPMYRASSVSVDDRALGRAAIETLLDSGCQSIAVFGGNPQGTDSPGLRAAGVRDAYIRHGMPAQSGFHIETRFTLKDAYDAALRHFQSFPETDAAFCMSDIVALGVMRALKDLGRRVPEDVSVLGVDGIEIGEYTAPRLSTLAQPVGEIAQKSVQVLSDMMENGAPAQHVTVPAALTLRESVRKN